MTDAADIISQAKNAMKRGEHAAALAILRELDLAGLDAMTAIRALVHMSGCAKAMGLDADVRAFQRRGLAIFADSGLAAAPDLDTAKLGLMLAIGAGDLATAGALLPTIFPDIAGAPLDFRISPVVLLPVWCRAHGAKMERMDELTWHAVIPCAEILAGWDFAFAPAGDVLEGANHFPLDAAIRFIPHVLNRSLSLVLHLWSHDCISIDHDALFMVSSPRHHYGHWIADFLPRLRA